MAFPNPFNKQTQQQQPQANFSLIESELEKKVDYFNK
jgi:hypothetical protein